MPSALQCLPPPGIPAPPQPTGTVVGGPIGATPEEAFDAFYRSPGAPKVAGSSRKTFIDPSGKTIGFASGYDDPTSFLLVAEVEPVEGGWTVTRWQSAGC